MDLAPITPETRPKTEQEVFDYVVRFLRKQGRQAIFDGTCVYKTPDGLKCAAGCLIPESEYSPEFEVGSLDRGGPQDEYFRTNYGESFQLLIELQKVHDHEDNPEMWDSWFRNVASQFGLTMPEPD